MGARRISVLNMKGGVGKTTLAVNLSWVLAELKNKRVLLVDLDPQFNASQYLLQYTEYEQHIKNKRTIVDIFQYPFKNIGPGPSGKEEIKPEDFIFTKYENDEGGRLDLLPSQLELSTSLKGYITASNLYDFLKLIGDKYDYILIDCAPTDSSLTIAAFASSHYVLIPVTPDPFAIIGFPLIQQALSYFRKNHADLSKVEIMGTIFTNVEEDATTEDSKESIRNDSPYTFDNEMRWTKYYRHSVKNKVPIYKVPGVKQQFKDEMINITEEFEKLVEELNAKR